jgi:hypothetical protein
MRVALELLQILLAAYAEHILPTGVAEHRDNEATLQRKRKVPLLRVGHLHIAAQALVQDGRSNYCINNLALEDHVGWEALDVRLFQTGQRPAFDSSN